MRTQNESSYAFTAFEQNYNNNTINSNKNNNNICYNGGGGNNSNNRTNHSNIPYHARENSLPFSYGSIGKTSTPLKSVRIDTTTTSIKSDLNNGLNGSSSSNSNYRSCYPSNNINRDFNGNNDDIDLRTTNTTTMGKTSGASIKQQPRLTSPLLVRKTLNSSQNGNFSDDLDDEFNKIFRSTISNSNSNNNNNNGSSNNRNYMNGGFKASNTISNSYPYSYGNYKTTTTSTPTTANISDFGKFGLDNNNKYNDTLNGNGLNSIDSKYSNNGVGTNHYYGSISSTGSNNNYNKYNTSNGYGGRQRTPTRNDFEELFREKREKVYNEYRTTTTTTSATDSNVKRNYDDNFDIIIPPPPHQFRNGYAGGDEIDGSAKARPKYNYDIEFNLNLKDENNDDDWLLNNHLKPPTPPVRRATMERSTMFTKQQQQQQQQYQTRDIELPDYRINSNYDIHNGSGSGIGGRNYNTYSGSSAVRTPRENYEIRPTTNSSSTMKSEQYVKYSENDGGMSKYYQQQQAQSMSPQQQQQQQQQDKRILQEQRMKTEYTTYGGAKSNGYGNSNNSSNNTNNDTIYRTHNNNDNTSGGYYTEHIYRTSLQARNHNDTLSPNSAMTMRHTLSPQYLQQQQQTQQQPIYATTTKQTMRNQSRNVNTEPDFGVQQQQTLTTTSTMSHSPMLSPSTPHSRPETPAFPVTPRMPYAGNISPNGRLSNNQQHYSSETIYQLSGRPRLNSTLSIGANSEPQEVAAHLVKFAKDSSKFWYKPNLSRDDAINLLLNAPPGTFLVRDSTTYKNAYGLVLRVAQPPPNAFQTGKPDDLVRHFLIEPTTRGVRLKGCPNEPVFTSLSALVYEHSINQLALPCLLRIPEEDLIQTHLAPSPAQKQLQTYGAACNVLWLYSSETESLTGEEAIRKAIRQLYAQNPLPESIEVHFKVSQQGVTLTDNSRKKFFRKHYAGDMISYFAIDPDHHMWTVPDNSSKSNENSTEKSISAAVLAAAGQRKTIFAFVARRSPSSKDNQCHIFCDLAPNQPASAIVSFANKTLPTEKQRNNML